VPDGKRLARRALSQRELLALEKGQGTIGKKEEGGRIRNPGEDGTSRRRAYRRPKVEASTAKGIRVERLSTYREGKKKKGRPVNQRSYNSCWTKKEEETCHRIIIEKGSQFCTEKERNYYANFCNQLCKCGKRKGAGTGSDHKVKTGEELEWVRRIWTC